MFDCNLNKNYPILIIFGKNIPETTGHQTTVQFPISPIVCFYATWRMQNQQNITHLQSAVLLLNLNNAQENLLFTFLTLWMTFH